MNRELPEGIVVEAVDFDIISQIFLGCDYFNNPALHGKGKKFCTFLGRLYQRQSKHAESQAKLFVQECNRTLPKARATPIDLKTSEEDVGTIFRFSTPDVTIALVRRWRQPTATIAAILTRWESPQMLTSLLAPLEAMPAAGPNFMLHEPAMPLGQLLIRLK